MKILLVTVHSSTFTRVDFEILSSRHLVTYLDFSSSRVSLLKISRLIKQNDLIYFWFISLRFITPLLLSKLLRRKVIFVAGGYDVAGLKELNYGSMSSEWKSLIIKGMIKISDRILSVSKSNYNEVITNCKIDPDKLEMIYHGFKSPEFFDLDDKEDKIVTIGFIDNTSFYRKGIDRFLKLAGYMVHIDFNLIGRIDINLNNIIIPENVRIHGYLGKEQFIKLLRSAKIYVQLSRHEAFGYSVAEAMQYGCIPVVSNCYSLPEVVGNTGLIVNDAENYKEIAEGINILLKNYDKTLAIRCIERVNNLFSLNKRSEKILDTINSLNEGKS